MAGHDSGTLRDTSAALGATLKSMYQMSPVLVVFLFIIVFGITTYVLTSVKLMMGFVLLIVLLVTVVVFATTSNFGEATVALVAGVLTAYTVAWTPAKFVAFVAVWFGFSALAIIISSIKLAARSEAIFREAAIALSRGDVEMTAIEGRLKEIADNRELQGLGPIERGEVVRLFSFRKLPLDAMPDALRATVILSVITQLPHMQIAVFVADAFKVFEPWRSGAGTDLADVLYGSIKGSAVPPADYIKGFEHARHLILGGQIEPVAFLNGLQSALEAGIRPELVAEAIPSTA